MHDGCSGHHTTGKEIVDKIRMMGFNTAPLAEVVSRNWVNSPGILHSHHPPSPWRLQLGESRAPSAAASLGTPR